MTTLQRGSTAELTLEAQLEQDDFNFDREFLFAKPRRYRADFVIYGRPSYNGDGWVPNRLLVEIEGGIGGVSRHVTYTGFSKDCEKYAAAAILGYRVIRATSRQVEDGTALGWIRAAIGAVR